MLTSHIPNLSDGRLGRLYRTVVYSCFYVFTGAILFDSKLGAYFILCKLAITR